MAVAHSYCYELLAVVNTELEVAKGLHKFMKQKQFLSLILTTGLHEHNLRSVYKCHWCENLNYSHVICARCTASV